MTRSVSALTYCEFFAGGGMARLGLGGDWRCIFANEWCAKKAAAYRGMFGRCPELLVEDVAKVATSEIQEHPELIWASFPCQDLSLAGNGAGLDGNRSGTFKPFWRLVRSLNRESRRPRLVVLENVVGTLTSHDGRDFSYICARLEEEGYHFGAMVVDAVHFLPQSRPRLFIVAAAPDLIGQPNLISGGPQSPWHSRSLLSAYGKLPPRAKQKWIWWKLPVPSGKKPRLMDIVDTEIPNILWHTPAQTERLLGMMAETNMAKVREVQETGVRRIGTVYRRTRPDPETGGKTQRAEVRFDDVAGCLRTPAGGSSRQILIEVEGDSIRTRLLSPREAARLMGVPEKYPLPRNYNEAYHLFGDGLAVPVVNWISKHLLLPLVHKVAATEAA